MDCGIKMLGHSFGALEIAMLFAASWLFKIEGKQMIVFALSYLFIRIAGFDLIYNWVRGIPMWDAGTTSLWDQVVSQIPPIGMGFIRIWFLGLGVGLSLKYLKNDEIK